MTTIPTREAVIIRIEHTDEGTFGVIAFGRETCRTIELPWRDNKRKRSCILPGRYRCLPLVHPRFARTYLLQDVPGRSGILIHTANLAGDVTKGWDSQLEGCIAPFDRPGHLRSSTGRLQRAGLVSRPAMTRLIAWGAGQPFDILIRDF